MVETSPPLIQHMQQPDFYPHPVQEIRLLQTHISWVLLTGDYAYKIKKPVNFGFLDFSTLEKRQHFCQEELRLNQRLAPQLYLEVVPITVDPQGCYHLGGTGPVVEYTVKMRQFDQNDLWLTCFEQGRLTTQDLEKLGEQIAQFHQAAATNDYITSFGAIPVIQSVVDSNYAATATYVQAWGLEAMVQATKAFTDRYFHEHADWFIERQQQGKIRECHGDLHLFNICFFQGQICVFDCIEFNDEFRLTDVAYDVAFLVMDLEFRGRRDLAYAFLNRYLELTGDYLAARLLPFYCSVRAYVRAKVNSFLSSDLGAPASLRQDAKQTAIAYYQAAYGYSQPTRPKLFLMTGLSGSGKSTVGRYLSQTYGAIQIRSDAVRKHLAGVPLYQRGGPEIYTSEMSARTYAELLRLGVELLRQGQSVVLDAKYDWVQSRGEVLNAVKDLAVDVHIIHTHAPVETLRERLQQRTGDIADATADLLPQQLAEWEPFTDRELAYVITIDTTQAPAIWQQQLQGL
ncbi:MAG: AAA family ATPase [Gloeomargarita sp. SKYG116]|nr:AAA family ATPase [Gloeomargarita sp. SKYG116]MDW8401695.1 AAA family ATPase [Gloeomargarita sp. SKYGB_i_bin116]